MFGPLPDPKIIQKQIATPVAVSKGGTGATTAQAAKQNLGIVESFQGQCRLEYASASQLTLKPHNGNKVLVYDGASWVLRDIPSAGLTLGAPAAADTTYYVYCYDNAGSLALEAATTGHATDSSTGFEVKSSDATRLLVGMARSNASIQWQDGSTIIGVLSWFNRTRRVAVKNLTTHTSVSTAPWFNVGGLYVQALSWGNEAVVARAKMAARQNVTTPGGNTLSAAYCGIGKNSTSAVSGTYGYATRTYNTSVGWAPYASDLSAFVHYVPSSADAFDTFYLLGGEDNYVHELIANYCGIAVETMG